MLSRDVCLEEAPFSLLPPPSLAGLVQGESKNTFPKMYWSLKMLGEHMVPYSKMLGNTAYSSPLLEAYDIHILTKPLRNLTLTKPHMTNTGLPSGAVHSAPAEHPQGAAAFSTGQPHTLNGLKEHISLSDIHASLGSYSVGFVTSDIFWGLHFFLINRVSEKKKRNPFSLPSGLGRYFSPLWLKYCYRLSLV